MGRSARLTAVLLILGAAVLAPRAAEAQNDHYLGIGTFEACGITPNGELRCIFNGASAEMFPGSRFKSMAMGRNYEPICAIRIDDQTMCTGFDPGGFFGGLTSNGPYKSISLSIDGRAACGVTLDGQLKCFGHDTGDGFTRPGGNVSGPNASTDTYTEVSVGYYTTCGLTTSGHINCWGLSTWGITGPTSDFAHTYTHVSNGIDTTCGIRDDGHGKCWYGFDGSTSALNAGPSSDAHTYKTLEAGYRVACGVRDDNSAVCFTNEDYYGVFAAFNSSGESFAGPIAIDSLTFVCGTKIDGHLYCVGWGDYSGRVASTANASPLKFASGPPDVVPPVITLNGPEPMTIAYRAAFVDPGATAYDPSPSEDLTSAIVITGNVDSLHAATYTRTYKVTDAAGNTVTATRHVIVTPDTNPPTLTFLGVDPIVVPAGQPLPSVYATAYDAEDGDVTSRIQVLYNPYLPGTQTATYRVTDLSGNLTTRTRLFNVVDSTPPQINVYPVSVSAKGPDGGVADYYVYAWDQFDPAPRIVCTPPSGSLFPEGRTAVTCTATDASGNSASASSWVRVFGLTYYMGQVQRSLTGLGATDPALASELQALFDQASQQIEKKRYAQAIAPLVEFERTVIAHADSLPYGWYSVMNLINSSLAAVRILRSQGSWDDHAEDAWLWAMVYMQDNVGLAQVPRAMEALVHAELALLGDDTDRKIARLNAAMVQTIADEGVPDWLADGVVWTGFYAEQYLLGYTNPIPNAWYSGELFAYAAASTRAIANVDLRDSLNAQVVRAMRELVNGNPEVCDTIAAIKTRMANELAKKKPRLTQSEVDAVNYWLDQITGQIGCPIVP